jgi:hypothetical protein
MTIAPVGVEYPSVESGGNAGYRFLSLAGLEPALHLVDHIDAALAPHETVRAMPAAQ